MLDEKQGPVWDTTRHAPERPETWVRERFWHVMGDQPNVQIYTLRDGVFRNDEQGRCWRLVEV